MVLVETLAPQVAKGETDGFAPEGTERRKESGKRRLRGIGLGRARGSPSWGDGIQHRHDTLHDCLKFCQITRGAESQVFKCI